MADITGPLTQRFDLGRFVDHLLEDYEQLRQGVISIPEARARADSARQVLRGVRQYVELAKHLERAAPVLPAPREPDEEGNGRTGDGGPQIIPPPRAKRRRTRDL